MADKEFVGKDLYAQWIWSGGTVQLNTDFRNFKYDPSIEVIDATAGGDTNRKRLKSFKDGQVTASILLQSNGGTASSAPFVEGTDGTIIYGPAGTATGMLKRTIPAFVQSASEAIPYNDVVSMDITWQQDGARVDGNW